MSGSFFSEQYINVSGSPYPRHAQRHNYPANSYEYQAGGDRQFCEYCHGHTKTDDRGNCIACGAQKPPLRGYVYA